MRTYSFFFFWLLLWLLNSCTSYRFIDIQVLNPGKVKPLLPFNELHIIAPQKLDSAYNIVLSDTSIKKYDYYKLLINSFDSTLLVSFTESPAFQKSQIAIQNENDFQKEMKTISPSEQEKHLLLTIKSLVIIDTISGSDFIDIDYNYEYAGVYVLYYLFKIELQNIANPNITNSHVLSDTLIWTGKGNSLAELKGNLPTNSQAIKETGQIAAKKYSEVIAPYWSSEKRILYFNNNKYMRRGYRCFSKGNLDEAIKIWEHLYENGTRHLASIAAHNIGLTYEILDDLDNSELWLNNSIKIRKYPQTEKYLKEIKIRKALRVKLDNQLIQP